MAKAKKVAGTFDLEPDHFKTKVEYETQTIYLAICPLCEERAEGDSLPELVSEMTAHFDNNHNETSWVEA